MRSHALLVAILLVAVSVFSSIAGGQTVPLPTENRSCIHDSDDLLAANAGTSFRSIHESEQHLYCVAVRGGSILFRLDTVSPASAVDLGVCILSWAGAPLACWTDGMPCMFAPPSGDPCARGAYVTGAGTYFIRILRMGDSSTGEPERGAYRLDVMDGMTPAVLFGPEVQSSE